MGVLFHTFCNYSGTLDFLKSPSFLISGSGGRPVRELPLPRARYFGVSRFRNRASKKKKHSELDLWASLVEPRYNEPLHKEDHGITNDILQPCSSKTYGKAPRYNEPPL